MTFPDSIRIGTLVGNQPNIESYIGQILPHGFESISVTFWQRTGSDDDLRRTADAVARALSGSNCIVSSVGIYGNPLENDDDAKATRESWERLIRLAPTLFKTDIVAGFAGRVRGKSIPDSMSRFAEVFAPLAAQARQNGMRIAFENCAMDGNWQTGDWNIAHNADAWERMFNAVPAENLGLQWEPCHQMLQLIDPLPQLRKWIGKVFHVHGKDATVLRDVIATQGFASSHRFAYHRTPGFGDTNWTDVISELRMGGFKGSIDIEGWHDPVYRDHLEMTGQVHGLNYLKRCRATFVANPSV
jgi:sugar phosphate isomerase/epimerase